MFDIWIVHAGNLNPTSISFADVGRSKCSAVTGAHVLGAVLTDAKAALARQHGCDHPIIYGREDVVSKVRMITDGAMVTVVFDAVGKDTFEAPLDSLRRCGHLASDGTASGSVAPFDISMLGNKGSLTLPRRTLATYGDEGGSDDARTRPYRGRAVRRGQNNNRPDLSASECRGRTSGHWKTAKPLDRPYLILLRIQLLFYATSVDPTLHRVAGPLHPRLYGAFPK